MSAFDNYLKDDIVDSIVNYVSDLKERNPTMQYNEVLHELMETISYGIEKSIYTIENN